MQNNKQNFTTTPHKSLTLHRAYLMLRNLHPRHLLLQNLQAHLGPLVVLLPVTHTNRGKHDIFAGVAQAQKTQVDQKLYQRGHLCAHCQPYNILVVLQTLHKIAMRKKLPAVPLLVVVGVETHPRRKTSPCYSNILRLADSPLLAQVP